MPECTLEIRDEVNVKFVGLSPGTRRKLSDAVKYFLPYAYHMPAYKLGRWDGCQSYFTVGGVTYINLLDKVLPIIMDQGYHVDIDDLRKVHTFDFPTVDETTFQNRLWPEKHQMAGEPITLRDYQIEIVNKFLSTPHCLQEIATGAGKTLITAALSERVEQYGRSIVIVPNKDLVRQTADDYANLGQLIRAVIVLSQMNLHIWHNETEYRKGEGDGNLGLTHGLNGIRNNAKNVIQDQLDDGGRKDYKVDCIAEEFDDWEVSW